MSVKSRVTVPLGASAILAQLSRGTSQTGSPAVNGAHKSRTCLASGYDSALVLKVCQVTCSRLWEGALWRRTGLHQGSILCCQRWRPAEGFTLGTCLER